ncbi:MAG: SDR family NAD(P)-dependent oxidoreductase [Mesorhizobium sp.]
MTENARSMEGKVVIVTGAGRGIGRAIAMQIAAEGGSVIVNDIGASLEGEGLSAGPAEDVVAEIRAAGGKAAASTLSITDYKNAAAMVDQAVSEFGRLDGVVNNAGILRDRIFHKMTESDWLDVLGVHLNGSFNLSNAAAQVFRKQESGAYVHMTSTSGLVGQTGQANYMAAKMGIVGLARGIALDLARYNVRSNCVAPFAWSRMTESVPAETPEMKARIERAKLLTPETVSPLVTYLLSGLSDGVSGQVFCVRRNEIFLFNQMRPIRAIHRSEGWTPARLGEQLRASFQTSFTPPEESRDVFSWPSI